MGANTFTTHARGNTAKEAFDNAVTDAKYYSGHGRYTGTIAEKGSFVMIEVPEGETPFQYAEKLIDEDDQRVSDKWGPAGCIQLNDKEYLFFGWASC